MPGEVFASAAAIDLRAAAALGRGGGGASWSPRPSPGACGRRRWDSLGGSAGAGAPARPAASSAAGVRAPGGARPRVSVPVPVAVLILALLAGPEPAVALQHPPHRRSACKRDRFGKVEAEGRGASLACALWWVWLCEGKDLLFGMVCFSCGVPPCCRYLPTFTGESNRRKEKVKLSQSRPFELRVPHLRDLLCRLAEQCISPPPSSFAFLNAVSSRWFF